MQVKDLMITDVITLPKTATYEQAAKLLYSRDMSGVCVVDEAGKLVGVISEKDLFRVLYPSYGSFYLHPEMYIDLEAREKKALEIRNQPIESYITRAPISVDPEMPILMAGAKMLAERVHRLPVVKDGKLVGVLTRSRVFNKILKENFEVQREK